MQDIKSNKTELIFNVFIIYCVFVIIHFNQYYWLQTEIMENLYMVFIPICGMHEQVLNNFKHQLFSISINTFKISLVQKFLHR